MAKPKSTNNTAADHWGEAYTGDVSIFWTIFPQDLIELTCQSLTPKEILMILVLKTYAAGKKKAHPSLKLLAQRFGEKDHGNVAKLVDSLATKGWIIIIPPDGEGRGHYRQYDLSPVLAKLKAARSAQESKGSANPQDEVVEPKPKLVAADPNLNQPVSVETSEEKIARLTKEALEAREGKDLGRSNTLLLEIKKLKAKAVASNGVN